MPANSGRVALRVGALVVLVYGCGLLTGVHVVQARNRAPRTLSPLQLAQESYFEHFVRDFKLDARQRVELRLVLEERAKQQKDWWTNRYLRDDPRDRAELVRLDRTTEGVIRELLREDQLRAYNKKKRD